MGKTRSIAGQHIARPFPCRTANTRVPAGRVRGLGDELAQRRRQRDDQRDGSVPDPPASAGGVVDNPRGPVWGAKGHPPPRPARPLVEGGYQ